MKNRTETTYLFRPDEILKDVRRTPELMRYNGGNWIPDDGKTPDLAFYCKANPFAYGVSMPYRKYLLWSYVENGNWGADVEGHPNLNAWHYVYCGNEDTDFQDRDKHPNEVAMESAMDQCSNVHSCANGNSVEFQPQDRTIQAGLLWEKDGTVVKPPEILHCVRCHKELDWQVIENESSEEREERLEKERYLELDKKWGKIAFPVVNKVAAKTIGMDLVPMSADEVRNELGKMFKEFERKTGKKVVIVGDELPVRVFKPVKNGST